MSKPAKTWRDKGIDIAAWESRSGFSFTFRKTYKDKTSGEYKESKYFYTEDLERLASLLIEALSWAGEESDNEKAAAITPAPPPPMQDSDDIPF